MKSFANLLLGSLTFLAIASCTKGGEATPAGGPKEYDVEYYIDSFGDSKASLVSYYNETGGETKFSNVKLPATYKFKRTMKTGDIISVSASLDNMATDSEISTTIRLNGKTVDSKRGYGGSLTTATYTIGQP